MLSYAPLTCFVRCLIVANVGDRKSDTNFTRRLALLDQDRTAGTLDFPDDPARMQEKKLAGAGEGSATMMPTTGVTCENALLQGQRIAGAHVDPVERCSRQ